MPVAEIAATVSRVTPPEASRMAAEAAAARAATAAPSTEPVEAVPVSDESASPAPFVIGLALLAAVGAALLVLRRRQAGQQGR